jgi:hypothetical protein
VETIMADCHLPWRRLAAKQLRSILAWIDPPRSQLSDQWLSALAELHAANDAFERHDRTVHQPALAAYDAEWKHIDVADQSDAIRRSLIAKHCLVAIEAEADELNELRHCKIMDLMETPVSSLNGIAIKLVLLRDHMTFDEPWTTAIRCVTNDMLALKSSCRRWAER